MTPMSPHPLINKLLDQFVGVMSQPPGYSALPKNADIQWHGNQLVFTLKGLHAWLDTDIDYTEFRKALFASQINAELREAGLLIDLFNSTGKVDTNRYRLRHIE